MPHQAAEVRLDIVVDNEPRWHSSQLKVVANHGLEPNEGTTNWRLRKAMGPPGISTVDRTAKPRPLWKAQAGRFGVALGISPQDPTGLSLLVVSIGFLVLTAASSIVRSASTFVPESPSLSEVQHL